MQPPDGLDEKNPNTVITHSPAQLTESLEGSERDLSGSSHSDGSADAATFDGRGNHRLILHVHKEDGDDEDDEADGDEEDEDEDEEDEEDEDEDEEPALKYERLGGLANNLLQKDAGSALTYANGRLALGTHGGMVHILDLEGQHIKSFSSHTASVSDITLDVTGEFVATASIDGQVVVHSMSTPETMTFNMKRSLRTVALEPHFAKSSTRSVICGGMAGNLVLHEKGWLGYKETVLHAGEGPIWQVRWRDRLIAWANDIGVKIYDTVSQTRITFIDRPTDSPRADLFKCTLHWQDDSTLLIAWADQIKVARIRARPRSATTPSSQHSPFIVEITAVFQLDCMIAGVVPHPSPPTFATASDNASLAPSGHSRSASAASMVPSATLTTFLILAYAPPDTSLLTGIEATQDRAAQARKAAERPELRIISRAGEELAADALGISGYERWSCNDYVLTGIEVPAGERYYMVLSPRDIVVVKPRDWRDHVGWLVERHQFEEALEVIEKEMVEGGAASVEDQVDPVKIGQQYIEHLVSDGDFTKAAKLCPKVCGQDTKRWEDWIFVFAQKHKLQAIIPYIPTESPTLGHVVYEMVLAYFLAHDRQTLLQTIKTWPKHIYDVPAVIVAVQSELDRAPGSSNMSTNTPDTSILMECLAELYTLNRQPGKALPYFLRLRRPNVFDLIRENNLFTAVQDQALLLVEFDHELLEKRQKDGEEVDTTPVTSISLLVNHLHAIPVPRVVQQLRARPYYLYLYLDCLFDKDPHLTPDYADTQVYLYAEYAPRRLIDFLRASSSYNLEEAYKICSERDLVPEMVFLLGRMGDNKRALMLIIERLGDVARAIDFAKEQHDDDLWEDLLKYSETRPPFIRGLLENVGAEIDPVRLIRRIKNGLEIPGLKGALIKILHDFSVQVSLLEGCQTILEGDCADLAKSLHRGQTAGFFLSLRSTCQICKNSIQQSPNSPHGLTLLYLCRHVVHADCVRDYHGEELPQQLDPNFVTMGLGGSGGISGKIAFTAVLRAKKINRSCPVCHNQGADART